MLSYRPLLFETPSGEFASPEAYPRDALSFRGAHDLPTWKAFFEARDLKLREQLGLTVDPEKEFRHRDAEKQGLKKAFEREGLNASAASAHLFIVRTP